GDGKTINSCLPRLRLGFAAARQLGQTAPSELLGLVWRMNKLSQSSPHVSFRDYQNAYIIRSVPRPACSVVSATTCSNVAEHAVLRRSPIGHGEATLKACRNPG